MNLLTDLWGKVWALSSKPSQDEQIYTLMTIINKLLHVLSVLMMNEDPSGIIERISVLLDNVSNSALLSKLYCFIMCQCFYAEK